MASVIFFRAVNVGGHQKFQPSLLAKELAAFDVVNLGAAGTFVVRADATAAKLRTEIHRRLPFKPELMICPARDVLQLLDRAPFHNAPAGKDIGQFVSILPKPLPTVSKLPLDFPTPGPWEVRLHHITGQFVLSVRRPGKKDLYPNAIVEKHLATSATTRNWNTFIKIGEILQS